MVSNLQKESVGSVVESREKKEKTMVVYFDLMRHANRFAGKGKWSDPVTGEEIVFDDTESITPEGRENARAFGAALPKVDFVVGSGSFEDRAGETAKYAEEGAGHMRVLKPNQFSGISYGELSYNGLSIIKQIRLLIEDAASKFPDYGRILPEVRAKVRERCQEVGMREAMKDEIIVQEMAGGIAYNLYANLFMARSVGEASEGNSVAMPIVSHGMYNESFLLMALRLVDDQGKETSVKSLDELGGFFKPGESFRIRFAQGGGKETFGFSFTNSERQKLFKGKSLTLDWDKVKELAIAYDRKIHNGRSIIEEEVVN